MEDKAMTVLRLPLSSLKAGLLLGCCLSTLVTGIPALAQEQPALPDLEAVLPPPHEMPVNSGMPSNGEADNGEANGLTLLPENEAANEAMPAIVPTPIPEAGGEVAGGENPEATAPEPVEASADSEGWTGSLMFDDEKVKNLMAIYRAYLLREQQEGQKQAEGGTAASQVNVGDIIGKLTGDEKPKEIAEEVLKLSLNSIVFDSPTQWSMWVNGQRFSRKEAEEGFSIDNSQLRVIQANNREVTYVWTPITESYNLVLQRWEDKKNRGDIVTNTQVAQNERVDFDKEARTVTITLRPNQTFVSQFMSVMEGVDKPRATQAAAPGQPAGDLSAEPEEGHHHGDEEGHHHSEEGKPPSHEQAENTAPASATPAESKGSAGAKNAPARNYRNNNASPSNMVLKDGAPPSEPVDPSAGVKPEVSGETSAPFSDGKATPAVETPGKKVLSGSNQ